MSSVQEETNESKNDFDGNENALAETLSKMKLSSQNLVQQELFGGAIKISTPQEWRDVSVVRQVPDHQECYQDCTFNDGSQIGLQGTGGCLIVEILGREEDVKDEDAALFFFRDLADANGPGYSEGDVTYQEVWTVGRARENDKVLINNDNGDIIKAIQMPSLSSHAPVKACSCIGTQSIEPLKNQTHLEEGKADKVRIELCALRLEQCETDILITLTMPMSDVQAVEGHDKLEEGTCANRGNSDDNGDGDGHSTLFLDILTGFNISDWSLFG